MTTFYTDCKEITEWNARNKASNPTAHSINAVYARGNIHKLHNVEDVREAYGLPIVAASTFDYVHVIDGHSVMWCILPDFYDEVEYPTNEIAVLYIKFESDNGVNMFLRRISAEAQRRKEEKLAEVHAEGRDKFLVGWVAWEEKTGAMKKYEKLLADYIKYISDTGEPWVNISCLLRIGIHKLHEIIYNTYTQLKPIKRKQFNEWNAGTPDDNTSSILTIAATNYQVEHIFEPLAATAAAIGDMNHYNECAYANNINFFVGIVDMIYDYEESA